MITTTVADVTNGLFELLGAGFIVLSIMRVLRDEKVRGVNWLHVGFFSLWGLWNLYYYPSLDQWWSLTGGVFIFLANTVWLTLLVYYSHRERTRRVEYSSVGDMYMGTFTGKKFYPNDFKPSDVCIEDVAHALSMECRYGGHTRTFYSVAEHCCLLCDHVMTSVGTSRLTLYEMARVALLHDAAEAYVSDMTRPLKKVLPSFKMLENRVETVVFEALGVDDHMPDWLKRLDQRIIKDEQRQLFDHIYNEQYHDRDEALNVRIQSWLPEQAEREFLTRYHELTNFINSMKNEL